MSITLEELNKKIDQLEVGERLRLLDVPACIYHRSTGVGSTGLKKFIDSPASFKFGLTQEQEQKDAFDLGSAVHCLVLEPHLYEKDFVVQPASIKTRRGKDWDKFLGDNQGKIILKPTQQEEASCMAGSVLSTHREWFQNGAAEVSYWRRQTEHLVTKSRVDYEIQDIAVDLKTTADASPDKFSKKAIDFGYHIQNQLYINTTGLTDFVFVTVNNKAPYQVVGPLVFDENAKRLGFLLVEKAIDDMNYSLKYDKWPAYQGVELGEAIEMELAPWHFRTIDKLENELHEKS
jgi:hypothetical protein